MCIEIKSIRQYLEDLQHRICEHIQVQEQAYSHEKTEFITDPWQHTDGGGGVTKVMQGGQVIEKAGVNFSHIKGIKLPFSATKKRPELAGRSFEAMGVSVVIHPLNPYVPTTHLNVRFLLAKAKMKDPIWWFGGGYDLTPFYPFLEDCIHWHQTACNTCAPFGSNIYADYKKACDEYFYIHHRKESRGIGGLFFDDLNEWGFENCFNFMQAIGNGFIEAYMPILTKRKYEQYGERQRAFQLYRRGRYVEFNLVYDRGTLFGLESQGRTESILMSLPPEVKWVYDWKVEPGSPEEQLNAYLAPRNWLSHD